MYKLKYNERYLKKMRLQLGTIMKKFRNKISVFLYGLIL